MNEIDDDARQYHQATMSEQALAKTWIFTVIMMSPKSWYHSNADKECLVKYQELSASLWLLQYINDIENFHYFAVLIPEIITIYNP